MKELRYTGQFKKDLKRIINQPKKLMELNKVLDMLKNEIPLPKNIDSIPTVNQTGSPRLRVCPFLCYEVIGQISTLLCLRE